MLLVVLPLAFGYIVLMRYQSSVGNELGEEDIESLAYTDPLGEEGSRCGGPDRLPCGAGLACMGATSSSVYGVCEVPESVSTSTLRNLMQIGQSCVSDEVRCAPGLYCQQKMNTALCEKIDATAPHVASIKLEGAQPQSGKYLVQAGRAIQVVVQTVNASEAQIELLPSVGVTEIGTPTPLQKGQGGLYTSQFVMPAGREAELRVTVWSTNRDRSTLSLQVASQE